MERPTWKNTLYSGHMLHSLHEFAHTARGLEYPYFEWNGHILSSNSNNGMHKIGKWLNLPVCMASELDQPGGVQWCDGLRPILQDIQSMARDTLQTGTPFLLEIFSSRLSHTLNTVMLNGSTTEMIKSVKSVLSVLDDHSLRTADTDGSIASAVATLRVRVAGALGLCESLAA